AGNARHSSIRRGVGSTPRSTTSTVASALLAALTMTIAGCSGAEGSDSDFASGEGPGAAEETPFEAVTEDDAQRGMTEAQTDAMEFATPEGDLALTSPRGGDEAAAAPAAGPASNGSEGDESDVSEDVASAAS